jgi:hypothetical protein
MGLIKFVGFDIIKFLLISGKLSFSCSGRKEKKQAQT